MNLCSHHCRFEYKLQQSFLSFVRWLGRGNAQHGPQMASNNQPTFLCFFKASKTTATGAVSTAEAALAAVALVQLLSIGVIAPPGGMVGVCLVGLQKRGLAPSVAKGAHTMGVCSLFGTCSIWAGWSISLC